MSYILDALRRADAERVRGQVPGLHSQGAATAPRAMGAQLALKAGLIGLGVGTVVVLGALWAWRHGHDDDAAGTRPRVASASVPTSEITPSANPVVPPMPSTAVPSTAVPAITVPAAPAAVLPLPSLVPSPAAAPSPLPRPTPSQRGEKAVSAAAGLESARTRPVATPVGHVAEVPAPLGETPAASAPPKLYRFDELPDDVKRQLPALAIGGSAFSANPASRFVIVNGQLAREGDTLAPGLTLEQIRLKSAVLAFRGYRYGISF